MADTGFVGNLVPLKRPQNVKQTCSTRRSRVVSCAESATRPAIELGGILHAGMIVKDTEQALRFYVDVLGMEDVTERRPNLAFGGAFVAAGSHEVHLMELPNPDPKEGRPEHGGRDKHVAFSVKNIDPLIESLKTNGVFYTMSKSGRRAVFCRDIDSNALEFVEQPKA